MLMTSNAGAKIWSTRAYSGLSLVPDICDFRLSLIAAFSEFTPSTPSLTAEPTIDDSNFILNQMVQNQGRIQEIWSRCVESAAPATKHYHFAVVPELAQRKMTVCRPNRP